MFIEAKRSEIALKRQRGTYSKPGSTNRSVWTTTLADSSFPYLGLPQFGATLNAIYIETVPVSAKMCMERL
jgi:hypothetical protein